MKNEYNAVDLMLMMHLAFLFICIFMHNFFTILPRP